MRFFFCLARSRDKLKYIIYGAINYNCFTFAIAIAPLSSRRCFYPTQGRNCRFCFFHWISTSFSPKNSPNTMFLSHNWQPWYGCVSLDKMLWTRGGEEGTRQQFHQYTLSYGHNLHVDDLTANCLPKDGEHVHDISTVITRKRVDESLQWKFKHPRTEINTLKFSLTLCL